MASMANCNKATNGESSLPEANRASGDTTGHQRHDQELHAAQDFAASIIQTIPTALLVLNPDLRVQLANNAFYTMFQVSPAETEDQLIYALGNGQWNIAELRTLLEDVLPENHSFAGYEVSHHFEAIGTRTMLLNGRRLDAIQLILLSITDITERKRAEEELRASEERYRLLVESAHEYAILMLDVAGQIATWNRGAERLFGYTEAEAVGQTGAILFTPEDRAAGVPKAEMETALRTGHANDDRWQLRKDGARFWANGAMEPLYHMDGEQRGFVKVLRDNSEQKAIDEALREREERYRTSLRNLPVVFAHVDRDLRYEWVLNPHPDFDAQQVIGKRDDELDQFPGIAALMQFKQDVFASGEQESRELTVELSDGNHIYDMTITPLTDESGEVTRLITAALDVTERRKEQAALHESEERYRTLFESMDEGFCTIEMLFDDAGNPVDYRFLTVNPAFAKQTGLTDAVGKRMLELEPRHEPHWFTVYGNIAVTGEPERFTQQAQYLDERWYDVYAFRIGEPAEHKVAIIFNDISERKRVELALEQLTATLEEQVIERTQQVRSLVGQLTLSEQAERQRIAQVLHDDLQQRLYGLQYRLLFLRDALEATGQHTQEQALQIIATMEEDLKESTELTRNLSSDFSPPPLEGEGLLEAMQWLATQMEHKHGLRIDLQVQGDLPVVEPSLRMLLFQTVREILFNIVKHAGVDQATLVLQQHGNHLRIIATDQGDGFDVAHAMRVEQRSQGLWQSQRRLELIGAEMAIDSQPKQGTRITITSPIHDGSNR